MGCSAMRLSTPRNQANGSIRTSSQEETKLRSTAAVLPPLSLPKKVQLLRPTAKLSSVISDLPGVSGRRILTALASGQTDPVQLAELGERLQCGREKLIDALSGTPAPMQIRI